MARLEKTACPKCNGYIARCEVVDFYENEGLIDIFCLQSHVTTIAIEIPETSRPIVQTPISGEECWYLCGSIADSKFISDFIN